jgi:superfamily II DNA/RNA helicase
MLEKGYKYTESMKDELDYYLYSHQIKTIENTEKYNNLLISTGPNSGKTNSYLMLIIDHVLKNKYEKGLKSIIVYPDKDSLKKDIDKIEKIIKNSNIEIGLILDNPLKHNSKNIIENKDILIKSPPDERKIFKKGNLKYIVFER